MGTILTWLQGLSAPLQILLIVVLAVVFQDQIAAYFSNKFGWNKQSGEAVPDRSSKDWFDDIADISNRQTDLMQQVLGAMGTLSQHYNHETTDLLTDIRDGIREIIQKQNEWERFGIPTRESKKNLL